jgi:hypothetical protein
MRAPGRGRPYQGRASVSANRFTSIPDDVERVRDRVRAYRSERRATQSSLREKEARIRGRQDGLRRDRDGVATSRDRVRARRSRGRRPEHGRASDQDGLRSGTNRVLVAPSGSVATPSWFDVTRFRSNASRFRSDASRFWCELSRCGCDALRCGSDRGLGPASVPPSRFDRSASRAGPRRTGGALSSCRAARRSYQAETTSSLGAGTPFVSDRLPFSAERTPSSPARRRSSARDPIRGAPRTVLRARTRGASRWADSYEFLPPVVGLGRLGEHLDEHGRVEPAAITDRCAEFLRPAVGTNE